MDSKSALFAEALQEALRHWRWSIGKEQVQKLFAHHNAMVEANSKFNLTRITDPAKSALRHYADSLALILWMKQRGIRAQRLLDVGTGAGFPAVPLAVLLPELRVTAIDSTGKKASFVSQVAETLELANLTVVHARAEHYRPDRAYDIVTARAVARTETALRKCAALVASGGWFVAYKSANIGEKECAQAGVAYSSSRLQMEEAFPYELNGRGERISRSLLVFKRLGQASR